MNKTTSLCWQVRSPPGEKKYQEVTKGTMTELRVQHALAETERRATGCVQRGGGGQRRLPLPWDQQCSEKSRCSINLSSFGPYAPSSLSLSLADISRQGKENFPADSTKGYEGTGWLPWEAGLCRQNRLAHRRPFRFHRLLRHMYPGVGVSDWVGSGRSEA